MGTIIGFLEAACGAVAGVGGGGIFVAILHLIIGFDAKSSATSQNVRQNQSSFGFQ